MNKFAALVLNTTIILGLFYLDNFLGGGVLKLFKRLTCTFICFVKKSLREEIKNQGDFDQSLNLPVLAIEVMVLSLSMVLINQCKRFPRKDRIDELMKQSKDSLRETTQYLEKLRVRNILKEYSYLDDEPQEMISQMKLEIPILQMAMIDHQGTTRVNPETGDAGEPISITDTTILSVTSLIDKGCYESNDSSDGDTGSLERKTLDFNTRYLWDVIEEDSS